MGACVRASVCVRRASKQVRRRPSSVCISALIEQREIRTRVSGTWTRAEGRRRTHVRMARRGRKGKLTGSMTVLGGSCACVRDGR